MLNVQQLIDGHNKAILKNAGIAQPQQDERKKCNSRKKEECPLNEECLVNEVVYQATVKTKDAKETYIGLTANQLKARYRNHQLIFRHEKRGNETELSKRLWKLTEEGKDFTVAWKIIAKAKPCTNIQNVATFVPLRNSFY